MIESGVDVRADIDAINRGEATRHGDTYEINDRLYRLAGDGHTYPVSGVGMHQLDRQAFKALAIYNLFGKTPRSEGYLDSMHVTPEQRSLALRVWQIERGHE